MRFKAEKSERRPFSCYPLSILLRNAFQSGKERIFGSMSAYRVHNLLRIRSANPIFFQKIASEYIARHLGYRPSFLTEERILKRKKANAEGYIASCCWYC
jgi:hypothetical protein